MNLSSPSATGILSLASEASAITPLEYYTNRYLALTGSGTWAITHALLSTDNYQAIIRMIGDCATHIVSVTLGAELYTLPSELSADTLRYCLARGLNMRRHRGCGPVTIVVCDDIAANGDTAQQALMSYFREFDPDLAPWAAINTTFPNSVAYPGTPYSGWLIEDKFLAGRPAWQRVGADFTLPSTTMPQVG